jgi:hypothetical protein
MKLFAIYVGGHSSGAKLEVHDIIFCLGDTIEDCYRGCVDSWFGTRSNFHIDAYIEVESVDGYEVKIVDDVDFTNLGNPPSLYFVNIGGSKPGELFEYHKCGFIVAESEDEAKNRAKAEFAGDLKQVHVDNIIKIVDELGLENVTLVPNSSIPTSIPTACYIRI